jgi:DNA-binding CsgD family transcriptional regulator
VGKSALAIQVGLALRDTFPEGVVTIDVEQSRGSAGILTALADSICTTMPIGGVPAAPVTGAPGAAIRQAVALRGRRMLLVLDRADGAGAAVSDVVRAVAAFPGVRVLALSVRPLGVPGEQAVDLAPLALPGPDTRDLRANAAVGLFAAVAAAAGYACTDADLPMIAIACRATGGSPLAIELAAVRTRAMPVAPLAARLVEDPAFLLAPATDPRAPGRYLPSMRAVVDRTWSRLTADERALLRTASLFAGPPSVEQVAEVGDMPMAIALDALATLSRLHLVSVTRGASGSDARLSMVPLIAVAAGAAFSRKHPKRLARKRHTALVCGMAQRAAQLNAAGDELSATCIFGAVSTEVTSVLDHLVGAGDPARAAQLAGDVAPMVSQSGQFHAVAERLDAMLRGDEVLLGSALAPALIGYAALAFTGVQAQDKQDVAGRRLRRGLELARHGGNRSLHMRALAVACRAWPVMRDEVLAAAAVTEGLNMARGEGNPFWQARFEAWAGMLAHQHGDIERSATLGRTALARGRRCGDKRAILLAGILLQTLPISVGGVPGGIPSPAELLVVAQRLVEPRLESIVLAVLAHHAAVAGRVAEAAHWSATALDVVGSTDTWVGAGFAVMCLATAEATADSAHAAAWLHGMIVHRLDVLTANVPPHAADTYLTLMNKVESALGTPAFEDQVRKGAALTWQEATSAALRFARAVGTEAPGPDGESGAPDVPGRVAASTAEAGISPSRHQARQLGSLTARESQVLALIAEGYGTKDIAARLRVSLNSVSHHTSNVLAKLGVSNRTQAAILVLRREVSAAPR